MEEDPTEEEQDIIQNTQDREKVVMRCTICGAESFTQTDTGFYVCNVCSTQSQDFQEETVEYDTLTYTKFRIAAKKSPKGGYTSTDEDSSNRTSYLEALQTILKAQVHTLIGKGVNEDLKVLVGHWWNAYLRIRLAFFGEESPTTSTTTDEHNPSDDITTSTTDEPTPSTDITTTTTDEAKQSPEHKQSNDTIYSALGRLLRELEQWGVPKYSITVFMILSERARWMKDGTVPYLNGMKYLPQKLKHRRHKALLRPFSMPSVNQLRQICVGLCKLLNIQLPPLNTHPILLRFLEDLHLPPKVVEIGKKLYQLYDKPLEFHKELRVNRKSKREAAIHGIFTEDTFFLPDENRLPIPAQCYLLAMIIIAIKLVYVLDDEYEHSHYTQCESTSSTPPFLTMIQNMAKYPKAEIPWSYQEVKCLPPESVDKYIQFCREFVYPQTDANLQNMFKDLSTTLSRKRPLDVPVTPNDEEEVSQRLEVRRVILSADNMDDDKVNPASIYIRYPFLNRQIEYHSSFSLVVKICAAYAGVKEEQILSCVWRVEKKIFKSDDLEEMKI